MVIESIILDFACSRQCYNLNYLHVHFFLVYVRVILFSTVFLVTGFDEAVFLFDDDGNGIRVCIVEEGVAAVALELLLVVTVTLVTPPPPPPPLTLPDRAFLAGLAAI